MSYPQKILIIHNVRSAYNVGSLFRTAEASGISKIYLTGFTPAPQDEFGRTRTDIKKTALGAENMVLWEESARLGVLIRQLKKEGFFIVGIEQSSYSLDYKKIKAKKQTAFICGNEIFGLSPQILKSCDAVAEIKMKGRKESLNVVVATGVVLFRVLNV